MAINAACIWEVRSTATASNAGGGFFKTGASGTDFSQQDAPQFSLSAGTAAGAGSTIDHASAAASMVGNGLHIISGTNATTGWYEVTGVSGTTITLDRAVTTGVSSNIVFNVGGALSLQHSSDGTALSTMTAGNKVWIKSGTYTLTGTLNLGSQNGTNTANMVFEGYVTTRGDLPKGATRPLIKGAVTIWGTFTTLRSLWFQHTAGTLFSPGVRNTVEYVKSECLSSSAGAISCLVANYTTVMASEFISPRGQGLQHNNSATLIGCYFHDCDIGLQNGNGANNYPHTYAYCIFENCVTKAINFSNANNTPTFIMNCTVYGSENRIGTGVSVATTVGMVKMVGNIFAGLTTAVSVADTTGDDAGTNFLSDYNNFYNCGTDVTNINKGTSDIALNPAFTSVTQLTGTTATISSTTLTQSGADFSSVVDGRDYIYVASGTGATVGLYPITSHTTTTVTSPMTFGTSATADKVWQITLGHNFGVGVNMKAAGMLGSFPAALSTGYMDIGAVQRQEDYPATTNVRTGTTYGNGAFTGTLAGTKAGTFIG